MTTDELVTLIRDAKRRDDVVPAIAALLPPARHIDWFAVKVAIRARWGRATHMWIFTQAWKCAAAPAAPPRRGGLRRAGGTHDARRGETEGAP